MDHATPKAPLSPAQLAAPLPQYATPSPVIYPPGAVDQDGGRLSTSPKLPDLARMSVFGTDLFSGGFQSSLSSEQMAEENIPDVPKLAPAFKVDEPATHSAQPSEAAAALPEEPEPAADGTRAISTAPIAMAKAEADDEAIKPTADQPEPAVGSKKAEPVAPITPVEHKQPAASESPVEAVRQAPPASSIDTENLGRRSAASAADITPTKPLNVRKDESPAVHFEPPPSLQRVPTFGTDTSSPVKESDVLRDEIIKTLSSPNQSGLQYSESSPVSFNDAQHQSHARDSTYSLGDYYWTDTDNADQAQQETEQPQVQTMSTVPEEPAETAAAPDSPTTPTLLAKTAQPAQAPTPEPVTAPETPSVQPPAIIYSEPVVPTINPSASVSSASQISHPSPIQQTTEAAITEADIVSPTSSHLRRRFSWEAEDSTRSSMIQPNVASPVATAPAPAPVLAPAPSAIPTAAPMAAIATAAAASALVTESAKQSETSSSQDLYSEASVPKPTVAPATATANTAAFEPRRLSLADEKNLSNTTSTRIETPPADEHPALKLSDPSPPPTLSMPTSSTTNGAMTPFKDIMALNSSSERAAKFNEARVAHAVTDTGLDRWLTHLSQEHPEHMSKSFNSYQPAAPPSAGGPNGSQPSTQQPYYQQYLNASAPGTGTGSNSGTSSGRRIGGISMPSNVGGSTFSHSGNQIGTKSKELMQSAGKMGKGLFSKGKSKLKERGDKVFH